MERKNKMKNFKKIISMLIAAVIIFSVAAGSDALTVQASSAKWKKACKAYRTWLSKNTSKFNGNGNATIENNESYKKASGFLIIDLDKNGVPELLVSHPVSCRCTDFYVYTYKSGKVIQVKDTNGKKGKSAAITANTQANGNHTAYRCIKNHLHIWSGGGWWEDEKIYTVKKGKLNLYARGEYDTLMNTSAYIVNGKKANAKKYQNFMKKCDVTEFLLINKKSNRKKLKG